MGKDRPADMDSLRIHETAPKDKTPAPTTNMATVAKVAGGRVDGGGPKRPR